MRPEVLLDPSEHVSVMIQTASDPHCVLFNSKIISFSENEGITITSVDPFVLRYAILI